jgi:hypothetical protein
LKEGVIPDTVDLQVGKRARKRATYYCWKDEKLYFKGLYVPKPEEWIKLVSQMMRTWDISGSKEPWWRFVDGTSGTTELSA